MKCCSLYFIVIVSFSLITTFRIVCYFRMMVVIINTILYLAVVSFATIPNVIFIAIL